MFDLKKFIALIAIENRLMQLFYDRAEAAGLHPTFDVYHVLAGDEQPKVAEIEIMKGIFEFNVRGTSYERDYLNADIEFEKRTSEKNSRHLKKGPDNQHLNN